MSKRTKSSRTSLAPTEHDAQVAFFDYVRRKAEQDQRWQLIYAIPNQGRRSPGATNYFYREGMMAGYPDINVDWPIRSHDGHIVIPGLRIEHKRKGGRLTKHQTDVLEKVRAAGYMTYVCFSLEELLETTEGYFDLDNQIGLERAPQTTSF